MGVPRKVRKFTTCSSNSRIGQEEKRRICKPDHCQPNTIIGSLPRDLLVDVLSRVASSSFTDLFNAKLCCKDYLEAAEDEYILQHISMDKFPIVYWVPPDDESLSFLTRCILKGNPEAIFRRGMMEYFSLTRAESGLDYLKTAAKKGHPEAIYVYCMILLSEGDQSVLNLLNSRFQDWKIQDCRDKIRWVLNQIWINNRISLQQNHIFNCHHHHAIGFDRQVSSCQSCRWYQELKVFARIVNGVA